MFSKSLLVIVSFCSQLSFAQSLSLAEMQPLAIGYQAPVVPDTSAVSEKSVGTIIFDISSNSFKGLNASGTWDSMSAPGASAVTSGGSSERIERAQLLISSASTCSVISQSGSWISGAVASASICTLTLPAGLFSSAPTCVASRNGSAAEVGTAVGSSPTSVYVSVFDSASGTILNGATIGINIVCMGPK